jgi:hypothetical protein
MEANIRTQSVPQLGVYASEFGAFDQNPQTRLLMPEWAWRQYRKAQGDIRSSAQRIGAMFSSDNLVNTILRPYVDDPTISMDGFEAAIPISEVVSGSRGIEGNAFRSLVLTEPAAADKRFVRVGEKAEIPLVSIQVGQRTIDAYKFARGVELSYEVMRREPIDRVAQIIQLIAVQQEVDKLAVIMDVMVNGDGNASTNATSYNLSTLDSAATPGFPSVRAWVAFKLLWANPYMMTHALARSGPATELFLMDTGSANLPRQQLAAPIAVNFTPINRSLAEGTRVGITADAPANTVIGFDRRVAIERLFEIGADIRESQRWANNQTERFYFSEVEGYRVVNKNATKLLVVNA